MARGLLWLSSNLSAVLCFHESTTIWTRTNPHSSSQSPQARRSRINSKTLKTACELIRLCRHRGDLLSNQSVDDLSTKF